MFRMIAMIVLATVAWGACVTAEQDKKLSDADITKLLVGKWTTEEGKDKEPKVKSTFIYNKDNTFAVDTTIETEGKVEKISVTGTWKVENGVILDTVKTSNTERFKDGQITRDTVISINKSMLKYTTAKGRERTWKRAKD